MQHAAVAKEVPLIITLPGWDGQFDVDFDYKPGAPASYGPNGGDPGDPDQLEIELVVWEFSNHNYLVLGPRDIGGDLYHALINHGYEHSKPEDWYDNDTEFYDMNERGG